MSTREELFSVFVNGLYHMPLIYAYILAIIKSFLLRNCSPGQSHLFPLTAAKWRILFPLIFSPSDVKFFIPSQTHLVLQSDLGGCFNLPLSVFIKKYLCLVSFHDAVCNQNSKGCCKVGLKFSFQPFKLSIITHSCHVPPSPPAPPWVSDTCTMCRKGSRRHFNSHNLYTSEISNQKTTESA